MTLKCCNCGAELTESHPAFLGTLIVRCASLGSQIVDMRAQMIILKSRIKGKQIGKKTPEYLRFQRNQDLEMLAQFEDALPRMEGEFAGMRFKILERKDG